MKRLSRSLKDSVSKAAELTDGLKLEAVPRLGFSTSNQNMRPKGQFIDPVQSYAIFKGKAALLVKPMGPTIRTETARERRGSVMLTFMPAVGERKYDYQKKQCFSLSPTEVGSLISMGTNDSSEFFHDPSMLKSNAGQVRKSLSIKPAGGPSNGYFFSLSVVNNVERTNERLTVPVTIAEFQVLKTACNFALPHLLGWNQLCPRQAVTSRKAPELEWSR